MVWGAIAGAAIGGISSIIGGSSKNAAARKQASAQNKYNKKVYKFQWKESKRQYKHAVEALEIRKRNDEKNLQFQEANLIQQYDYGMGVRQYEHNQAVRAYDASVAGALQQQEYNQMAEKFALVDQDRLLHEQLIDLSFDRAETLLEYRQAAAGLGLKQRQALAGAATEAQATRVSALKAQGAAAARGVSGRSAARNIQGIVAETGARQAAIIDEPLPKPFALPRAEYQDVYKPKKPPKPMKAVAAQTNLFAAGLSGALSGAQTGMSIQSSLPSGGGGGGNNSYYGTGGKYGTFVPYKP